MKFKKILKEGTFNPRGKNPIGVFSKAQAQFNYLKRIEKDYMIKLKEIRDEIKYEEEKLKWAGEELGLPHEKHLSGDVTESELINADIGK